MRKILVAISLLLAIGAAHADDHGRGGRGGGDRWLGPAIIGGILGYTLAQPRTIYVQPAPQPIVVVPQGAYSGPAPQPVYQEFVEFDPSCNCYRHILRQIGWH